MIKVKTNLLVEKLKKLKTGEVLSIGELQYKKVNTDVVEISVKSEGKGWQILSINLPTNSTNPNLLGRVAFIGNDQVAVNLLVFADSDIPKKLGTNTAVLSGEPKGAFSGNFEVNKSLAIAYKTALNSIRKNLKTKINSEELDKVKKDALEHMNKTKSNSYETEYNNLKLIVEKEDPNSIYWKRIVKSIESQKLTNPKGISESQEKLLEKHNSMIEAEKSGKIVSYIVKLGERIIQSVYIKNDELETEEIKDFQQFQEETTESINNIDGSDLIIE